MKPILLSFLTLASIWLVSAELPARAASAEEATILKLEQQWEDALIKSDTAALDKLYDERIIYTHSSGKVDTKSTYINNIKSGGSKYVSMKRDDIKVAVYNKAAIVSCHWDVHILSQGNKVDLNARYLHVYVQQKDGWKMAAHQSTRVAP